MIDPQRLQWLRNHFRGAGPCDVRNLLDYIDTLEAAVTNAQKQSNIDLERRRHAEAELARLKGDIEREAKRIAEFVEEPWDL